ncbi:MAG: amino acid racemase [Deltaproteobacteria bacterium]|nr:amino acid racemase [Deltaproteobacteria bacterium]
MKTIGIIGGIGPESTIDYYRRIIGVFNSSFEGYVQPEIIIFSVNMRELMELVNQAAWEKMARWLAAKVQDVHRAGADFAAIASNTPHIVFDEVRTRSPIPLLSIVRATCTRARQLGLKNIGLMGTSLTMTADFYKRPFLEQGINVVVPTADEQQLIHHKLFAEIELGLFNESTRNELLGIAARMVREDRIDSLVLGCTELPLILPETEFGIPFLNTTAIHCDSIINYCLGGEDTP